MTDRPSRLEAHTKAVHEKVRDFSCPKCEFTTTTKYHLESHVKSCSQENKIPVVGKIKNPFFKIKVEKDSDEPKFKQKKKLKVKMKQEKNPEKAKPRSARSDLKQCPFTTKKKAARNKVALQDQCSFAANTAEELTKHMKIHIKSEKAN